MDLAELTQRAKEGKPLYGESDSHCGYKALPTTTRPSPSSKCVCTLNICSGAILIPINVSDVFPW